MTIRGAQKRIIRIIIWSTKNCAILKSYGVVLPGFRLMGGQSKKITWQWRQDQSCYQFIKNKFSYRLIVIDEACQSDNFSNHVLHFDNNACWLIAVSSWPAILQLIIFIYFFVTAYYFYLFYIYFYLFYSLFILYLIFLKVKAQKCI